MIERCFNRLKGFRSIATRYEMTAASYKAAVTLASLPALGEIRLETDPRRLRDST
ncbi:hypothetical protein [Streptomyces kronopolitis]|uniref:hypothetical protein n=1 Tax=Streptomyces kronopolitis TaxID=1612435 RepID=UPI003F557C07